MRYEKVTRFIDIFTSEFKSGEWIVDNKNDGTPEHPIQIPYVAYDHIVIDFLKAMNEFMDRKYCDTIKSKDIDTNSQDIRTLEYSEMSNVTILALLTYEIRRDRFCEGALKASIESGVITRLLIRLKELD